MYPNSFFSILGLDPVLALVHLLMATQDEEDRVILQHEIFLEVLGGLFFPPVTNPRRILDCGYGQGSWAVAMAQEFEESEVCCPHLLKQSIDEHADTHRLLQSTFTLPSFPMNQKTLSARCGI